MTVGRKLVAFLHLLAISELFVACKSDVESAGPERMDAGATSTLPPTVGPDGGGDGSWAASPCGSCALGQCARERTLCDAQPSCVAHARCVEACRPDALGNLDPACLAACPKTEGSEAARARAAYDTCLTMKGLEACDRCVKPTSPVTVLGQTCGASVDPSTCGRCEDEKCCQTFAACVAEPECKQALQPCLKACTTDTCRAACYAAHPRGVSAWAKRSTCMGSNCVTECGAAIDPCYSCGVMKECRDPNALCAADEGCFLLRSCLRTTCPDNVTDACQQTCKEKLPASAGALYDAWVACVFLSCVETCG